MGMAKGKRPRWESEMMGGKHVSDKIVCKTCMFAYGEAPWADEPTKGCCEIYEYPDSKPHEVYFDGAECENYEKDE
jgi:hypothetical protein